MYTIKAAASRAGVSVAALRAWERRYGVVQPVRTSSGYRLYDDEAIARLRAMRALIRNGWSARLAAEAVIEHGPAAADGLDADLALNDSKGVPDDFAAETLTDRFVSAARALDVQALDRVLDEMFIRGGFEQVMERHVFPALDALGKAWERSDVSVAGEHAASYAVVRRLAAAFDASGRQHGRARGIVVGLPPNARHEIGALAFATACRRSGLTVTYLGADLPIEDWLVAASDARAAVIGVPTEVDREQALSVAQALHQRDPGLPVAMGGHGAPESNGSSAFQVLPASLVGAVDEVRALVAAST